MTIYSFIRLVNGWDQIITKKINFDYLALIFFFAIFPILLMANIIFRKIYYRKFTDEYRIDFGEAPPK